MATNPGDGLPSNSPQTVGGSPYSTHDPPQDVDKPNTDQSASATQTMKTALKNFFKSLVKSDKSEEKDKPSKNGRVWDKSVGAWIYPRTLNPPGPMNIYEIMAASPEHLAVLARQDAQLKQQANTSVAEPPDVNQEADSSTPITDLKWSFDGKSMITYKDPGQESFNHPDQDAIPHANYQGELIRGMGSVVYDSTRERELWSNSKGADVFAASFPGNNSSQIVHMPRSKVLGPPSHPINMSNLRSPYEIAEAAHIQGRPGSKAEWLDYLNDYRGGQFNIMKPPKPPAIDPLFSYLPAMDPLNEQSRLVSLFTISPVWTKWQEERSLELVRASREEFGATGVSISLVDNSNEILKVEVGYNRRMIKRSESIAAHALLTTEVLVVLDTRKDWRFAKNPLVINEPKIRFFAGAPILSQSCEVVGVFVIFGREPRDSFSALQRRSLTDYGAVCASDLNTVMERSYSEQSLQSLQSQANTENWDPTYLQGEPKPRARSLWMDEETHRLLCGEPRGDEKDIKYPTTYAELMEQFAAASSDDDTAHYSEEPHQGPYMHGSQANFAYSSVDVNFSTPARERETTVSDYPLLGSDNEGPDSPLGGRSTTGSESPTSEGFVWRPESPTSQGLAWGSNSPRLVDYPATSPSPVMSSYSPRPYSVSDLTSVDGNIHPNTPTEREFGEASSSSQRIQDSLDHVDSVLRSKSPEVPIRRQRKTSIRSISKYESELRRKLESDIREAHSKATNIADSDSTVVTGSFDTSGRPSTQATTPPTSFDTRMSALEFVDTHRRPEADAAVKFVAQSLKFYGVYVAEIVPDGVAVTGMGVRILASYNTPAETIVDANFLLQVLRSPHGAMRWHDKDAIPGDPDKSLFIRLHSKGPYGVPRSLHTGGIVYAATHLAQLGDGVNSGITDQEQAILVDAANKMKIILFKKDDKRDRKDSSCTNCQSSSHVDNHLKPTPVVEAVTSGYERSIHSPEIEVSKVKEARPENSTPASEFEAEYINHPNSISVESMEEASRAVAAVLSFNMDEEMSPQW